MKLLFMSFLCSSFSFICWMNLFRHLKMTISSRATCTRMLIFTRESSFTPWDCMWLEFSLTVLLPMSVCVCVSWIGRASSVEESLDKVSLVFLCSPTDMFPILFTIPRTAGWLAHWVESAQDSASRIYRPRQIYVGYESRIYTPIEERIISPSSESDKTSSPSAGIDLTAYSSGYSRRRDAAEKTFEIPKHFEGD